MKPLDGFIVEDHNEALTWIYRQIGSKRLPVHGSRLLHLDSHPDLLLPAALTAEEAADKGSLLPRLSIGDWILPAVFAGHIGDVIWLRPPWARQLPEGERTCHVGVSEEGHLRLDAPLPYWVSEQLYAPTERLQHRRQFTLTVVTLAADSDVAQLAGDLTARLSGAPYILDIDLDFFSTRDPFLELYPAAGVHGRLKELFAMPAPAAGEVEAAQARRAALMAEARAVCDQLAESGGSLEGYRGRETPLLSALRELAAEVSRCYPDTQVDWGLVYDAACTFDVAGLPHHVCSPEAVAASVSRVGEVLAALPEPATLTVARSSLDNYCPQEQVEEIQRLMLGCLRRLYPRLSVQQKYDTVS